MFMRVFAGVLLSFCFAFSSWAAEAGKGISIFIAYTGIKPILEAFTRDTGIEVDYLEMSSRGPHLARQSGQKRARPARLAVQGRGQDERRIAQASGRVLRVGRAHV